MSATAVILAAGLGTRMRSRLPKVMHPIAGRPMLGHLITSCETVFDRIVVIVGSGMEQVQKLAEPHRCVIQDQRLGTAHAALQAAPFFGDGDVAVLYGDNALIGPDTMKRLLTRRAAGDAGLVLLAMRPVNPDQYGRVVTDDGYVERIVEWTDATEAEREIGLCNAGVLCARAADMARWLADVRPDNTKNEYYLTDVVTLARAERHRVAALEAPAPEVAGVNSRADLAQAEAVVQQRLRAAAMDAGVTMTDPASVFLCFDTVLAPDVTIGPNVVFGLAVSVAEGTEILGFSHLVGCRIGRNCNIGPFARVRPGTVIGDGVHIGNFVELKATTLGAGAKANHLTYLGDAEVGARTNIGAGTITCNYDGFAKHRTTIGANAFIGSDTSFVAPVHVGDGAMTGAGSVITEDISPDALAIARGRQSEKPGGAAAFRAKQLGKKG
jgi:bifunctional UDP-N-acetylglucosamine pyrophosphorylase / glucosamine-1-phosphate N-acetyltransferase